MEKPWFFLEWDQAQEELRPSGLVNHFQHRVMDHNRHQELNTMVREDGMAYGALKVTVIRENPSVSSVLTLEPDPEFQRQGRFGSDVNTRHAVFGAHFLGLRSRESSPNGNHPSSTISVSDIPSSRSYALRTKT